MPLGNGAFSRLCKSATKEGVILRRRLTDANGRNLVVASGNLQELNASLNTTAQQLGRGAYLLSVRSKGGEHTVFKLSKQ